MSVVTIPALAAIAIQWSKESWPLWIWLFIIAGCVFLGVFVSVTRRAYELEQGLEPKIKVGLTVLTEPKGATGRALRTMRIEVENESTLHLRNCTVREAEFINCFGQASGMRRHFRLSEESYADMSAHTYRKTFDLQGKGAAEIIDIALLDETKDDSRVVMLYATEPTAPTLNAIARQAFPHVLTISITSDNLSVAEKRTYQLSVSHDGILQMTPI